MACPVCFFRENYQKQLKFNSFNNARFEKKIKKYKIDFIEGVHKMESQAICECGKLYPHRAMIDWTDNFRTNLQNSEHIIQEAFDSIISVYDDFISKNPKLAVDNLWNYLDRNKLLSSTESSFTLAKLYFRARKRNGFNAQNIEGQFHIPFAERYKIRNQRFSVSGQPLLYLGSSIICVVKEMQLDLKNLSIVGFLPKYSEFYTSRIYNLKNSLNDCIENALPGLFEYKLEIKYTDIDVTPSQNTIKNDIYNTILFQLCTFPVEQYGSFVAEYIIPQILTTSLLEHNYQGVVFPSTKDYSDMSGNHRFSTHHINLGLFVPYVDTDGINNDFLNKFSIFILNGTEDIKFTTQDIFQKVNEIKNNRNYNILTNDHKMALAQMDLQLQYLSNALINGVKYYETEIGKYELGFYMKMLLQFEMLTNN